SFCLALIFRQHCDGCPIPCESQRSPINLPHFSTAVKKAAPSGQVPLTIPLVVLGSYWARRRQASAKQPSESSRIDEGSGTTLVSTLNNEVSNSWAVLVAPDGRMANVSNEKPPVAPGVASVNTTCAVPSPSSVPPVMETS